MLVGLCFDAKFTKGLNVEARVKEFFNEILRRDKQESRSSRHENRLLGYMPSFDYDVPDITDFSHFIECEVLPTVCPMLWESLVVDFENSDKRYCEYCNKFVYKADNEYMFKLLQEEKKCMAISHTLLEKMNGKIDQNSYNNLQDRLKISKLFLVLKKYEPVFFDDLKSKNLNYEEQLKEIFLYITDNGME